MSKNKEKGGKMGIIYIISGIILLVNFILIKKSDKEIDLVGFTALSIVLLFCYNTFICYVLTFLTIPCKLEILALINIIVSLCLIMPIIKNKKVQKYTYMKIDILYIFLIVFLLLIVAFINFGFPFEVNYISSDPSYHYLTSLKFAKEDSLMPNTVHDQVYGDVSVRKAVSYTNSGILMKSFSEDLDFIKCINIFIGFDIFTVVLIGIMVYIILKKHAKKSEHKFWAFLIALICTLGYPLNSMLSGFEYLTMGLLMICAIIDLVWYYENDMFKFSYVLVMFGLLNFGLFCSYYMFVPFMYPGLWIYFCIKNYTKTNKIITKELIILLLITLLIPFVLGYIYHLAPNVYAVIINKTLDPSEVWEYTNYIAGDGFATNGDIYVNLYSNMILLIPLTIYLFCKEIKENNLRENKFLGLIVVFCILFIEVLLIGNKLGRISIYYLSKNYFALWIMLAVTNYIALIYISETKYKSISRILIYGYIFIMIIYVACVPCIAGIRPSINPYENIFTVMDVFNNNKELVLHKQSEYNKKELEIMKYAKENLDFNTKIDIVSNHRTYFWSYVLLEYVNVDEEYRNKYGGQNLLQKNLERIRREGIDKQETDYVIYFNKSRTYKLLKSKLFENSEIIFENEAGGILRYKK